MVESFKVFSRFTIRFTSFEDGENGEMFNRVRTIAINTSNYNISRLHAILSKSENVLTLFIYTLHSSHLLSVLAKGLDRKAENIQFIALNIEQNE